MLATLAAGFLFLGQPHNAEGPPQTGAAAPAADGVPRPAKPIAVRTETVAPRTLLRRLAVTGSLRSDEEVEVGSRMEGRVRAVLVREGERVARGQVLLRLDEQEVRAQLARSRALLDAAQARLAQAGQVGPMKDTAATSERSRAQAALEAARSRVQQAETRARLVETETKVAVETAQAGVRAAADRLKIVKDVTRKQDLRQAQLFVEQAQARRGQAEVDAENARQVLERRKKLLLQDAVAREEVEEAERRYQAQQAVTRVAAAAVTVAEQKLDLAREGSRPEEVRISEGQYAAAERALRLANSEERRRQLANDEIAAAVAAREQAEAAVKAAQAGLVQHQMSQSEVRSARASVAQARADIRLYETQLDDLIIRAPVAGVVAARRVDAGEAVTRTTPLLTLVALDSVLFEASVPELEIDQVRPGQPAEVTVDSLPGRVLRGTVRQVIPVAERSTRAFRARIALAPAGLPLPSGGYARGTILVETRRGVPSIRRDALRTQSGDPFVWLIEGDATKGLVAHRRGVRTGVADGDYVELLDGVRPGQRIVAAGSSAVTDGVPVSAGEE